MKKLLKVVLVIFIILAGVSLFVLSNYIGGWKILSVLSSSMEPKIGTGSLVVVRKVALMELGQGDVITFIAPTKDRISVTHRIISFKSAGESFEIKTKGDNNKSVDSWTLFGGEIVGRVEFIVPFAGYGITFLKSKMGIVFLILIPSVWIIVDELNNIIRLVKGSKKNLRRNVLIPVLLVLFNAWFIFSAGQTRSLLSDSASLTNLVYKIVPDGSFDFSSCIEPRGTIIASYDKGLHEIVGVGLRSGSDVVYQLSEGSKEHVIQCYCSESGVGIQTNWLKTTEIDKYRNEGWVYSIVSGVSWNLDEGSYVARNMEYVCDGGDIGS